MNRTRFIILPAVLACSSLALTGCPKEDSELTLGEAREALTEASASEQAADLTSANVELTTSFTIGGAVQTAAAEIGAFIASQLPCADVKLANATLTVQYGGKAGSCSYRGHQFSGQSTVSVAKNEAGEVVVDHGWKDLSNGLVKVNGTAKVTWSAQTKSRRVQHDVSFTRVSDGRTGRGTGDRTQTVLEGGLLEGIQVDGSRTWEGTAGKWGLAIQGVQIRWADPVPQAGKYVLVTPKDKTLTLSFTRVDDDTIRVTVEGTKRSFKFNVHRAAGDIDDA